MKPIDMMLDKVTWKMIEGAAPNADGLPYATHEGVLDLVGTPIRCFQLNDGRRIFEANDLAKFFGFQTHEEFAKAMLGLEKQR